jgi:hypothetical protein
MGWVFPWEDNAQWRKYHFAPTPLRGIFFFSKSISGVTRAGTRVSSAQQESKSHNFVSNDQNRMLLEEDGTALTGEQDLV